MQMPVIDLCPLREPIEGKRKTKSAAFLRALGLKMEAPEPNKVDRISIQALAGVFAQMPYACELNLHLRDGRVVPLQWSPTRPPNPSSRRDGRLGLLRPSGQRQNGTAEPAPLKQLAPSSLHWRT